MSGHDELEAFARRVESMRTLNEDAAKAAAPLVLEALQETARAGTDPYGVPWPPKKDGGKALAGAADAIEISTKGPQVIARIGPPEGYHHWGAGGTSQSKRAVAQRAAAKRRHKAGGTSSRFHAPPRPILPKAEIPPRVNEAMVEGASRAFDRAMSKGGR